MTTTAADIATEDRATYGLWVHTQELAYIASGCTHWFDSGKQMRMKKRHTQAPRDAFTGSLPFAKSFMTQEAIDWFEIAGNPRYTFTDWVRIRRAERAAAAEFEAADNGALRSLEYGRELFDRRGVTILEAREDGASWADIMEATGLSRMTCHALAKTATAAAEQSAAMAAYIASDEPF